MTPLPGVLAEIADLAGKDAALAVARDHGGTRVHIPAAPQPDHWLSQLIGHPEATAVAAALALRIGLRIDVPFAPIRAQSMVSNADSATSPKPAGTGSQVLDDLAEVIGEQAAFALAEEFRGEIIYVPNDPDVEPRIAEAIGAEQARKLCDSFWRTYIPIPTKVVIERRVIDLADQGITKKEIARRLKIRQARVFSILQRRRESA